MIVQQVRPWLRLEGAAVLAACVVGYALLGTSWWWFAGLLLAPDLAMLGYLAGPRVGAFAYNAVHVYLGPVGLGVFGGLSEAEWALAGALIWAAHIGMDRALGYGLKAPSGFRDTHLGPIGRP